MIVEGRGKKKILKKLLPLFGILKLKLAALAVLSIIGIALIAKKALFTSLVALAVAGSMGLRKLLGGGGGGLSSGIGAGIGAGLGGGGLGGLGGLLGGGGGGGGNGGYGGGYSNGGVEEIIAYNT